MGTAGSYQTEIGGRLRLLREALGQTRAEFAALLGTNEGNLKEIEHGRQFPNPVFMRRLCATNMVDFNWIYSGHGHLQDEIQQQIHRYRRSQLKPATRRQPRRKHDGA